MSTDIREMRAEIAVRLFGWRLLNDRDHGRVAVLTPPGDRIRRAVYEAIDWDRRNSKGAFAWEERTNDWDIELRVCLGPWTGSFSWFADNYGMPQPSQHALGWVGVVIDAMKARGLTVEIDNFNGEWFAKFADGGLGILMPPGSSSADPEHAVLAAAIAALNAAEAKR